MCVVYGHPEESTCRVTLQWRGLNRCPRASPGSRAIPRKISELFFLGTFTWLTPRSSDFRLSKVPLRLISPGKGGRSATSRLVVGTNQGCHTHSGESNHDTECVCPLTPPTGNLVVLIILRYVTHRDRDEGRGGTGWDQFIPHVTKRYKDKICKDPDL